MTLTPLFRHTVGFDRLNELVESALRDSKQPDNYPPYNIEKLGTDEYRITMAVAGFSDEDLSIVTQNNVLSIEGRITQREDEDNVEYLHRGIATRAFERKFNLAEHVKVVDAELKDGILSIKLMREIPEEAKPRYIPINGKKKTAQIIDAESTAASSSTKKTKSKK